MHALKLTWILPALLLPVIAIAAEPAKPVRVVVWDEQQPAQKEAYENFLGNAIAESLKRQPGLDVRSMKLDDPEQGLSAETLDFAQVLVWWGHVRHKEIKPEKARDIVERVKTGRLALVALHSAHWSAPFVEAMHERTRQDARKRYPDPPDGPKVEFEFIAAPPGVPAVDSLVSPAYYAIRRFDGSLKVRVDLPNCVFPQYRADGKPSHVRVLLPEHPLAQGLPRTFDIPHTEMYNEPFHVPAPDEIVFEERWDGGERFRSGSVWKIGAGRVVYFRPGHETFPIYKQPETLQVIENAARWLGSLQE
ncbi:MAG: trehalose utilization protein [Planctomycetaceae bacterium]|nr:trehalose utilization protein [Planctomycetaceae bacterium]